MISYSFDDRNFSNELQVRSIDELFLTFAKKMYVLAGFISIAVNRMQEKNQIHLRGILLQKVSAISICASRAGNRVNV